MSSIFNKYTLLLVLFLLAVIAGCKDPLVADYENDLQLKIISGDNQAGTFNTLLADSIVVEVTHPDGTKPSGYKILAIPQAGGHISEDFKTTEDGIASFNWELGCGESQSLQLRLFGTECDWFSVNTGDCPTYDSIWVNANAEIQDDGWVKGCGLPDGDFFNVEFEETEDRQYLLLDRVLYISFDKGLSWFVNSFPSFIDGSYLVDIEISPSNGQLYGIADNHNMYRIENFNWEYRTVLGSANISSPLNGFTISDSYAFASFGSDGVFVSLFVDWDLWQPASQTIGFGQEIFKLESFGDEVYGIFGTNTEYALIYFDGLDLDQDWEIIPLSDDNIENPFGDFIVLPNEFIAMGSGALGKFSEFSPINFSGVSLNQISNSPLSEYPKSIKDIQYYDGKIYFLGFERNFINTRGSIYEGLNGIFDKVDFDLPCNNVLFFDVRNDGSFIVGCENGIFVLK